MQIYLVGGAVRDELLGLPVTERDWVVVGAEPAQLLQQGYKLVGKDFPVFLHPETHEEYALARTERKIAPGYHGFSINADTSVNLADDLQRRDLTINAIARDANNQLIDPYNGQRDLRERWLRHVSPAFAEDPVRILRIARFAARYARLGFRIAPETLQLMQRMVKQGEVDALVAERVWAELVKALAESQPQQFISVLRQCGALARILPELDDLFGVPQPARHHPEIDTGLHIQMCLEQAVQLNASTSVGFAVLMHDLGKGITPATDWPKHHEHEQQGIELVNAVCQRLRVPKAYRELALLVTQYHTHCHRALELRPRTVLKTLAALDCWRRPERFQQFLLACEIDARGRQGLQQRPYRQRSWLQAAQQATVAVDAGELARQGLKGPALIAAIRRERLHAIAKAKRYFVSNQSISDGGSAD